ncbi:MAG TPA: NERD domain-containing protein [Firmicutes bacterium]|nr:NERD domain-containing protein [Bacillota bacterium]
MKELIIGCAAIVILLFIIFGIALRKVKRQARHTVAEEGLRKGGMAGEDRVAEQLQIYARANGCKVINRIYLPLYGSTTEIDHILIGKFGVLVIETKNMRGQIYGTAKDREWIQMVNGKKKHQFYNPLYQNKTHIATLRHLLVREKMDKVHIEGLVVFCGRNVCADVTRGMPVIPFRNLQGYLSRKRFQEDCGVDVARVYRIIKKYEVTDRSLIDKHNAYVKKMARKKQPANKVSL